MTDARNLESATPNPSLVASTDQPAETLKERIARALHDAHCGRAPHDMDEACSNYNDAEFQSAVVLEVLAATGTVEYAADNPAIVPSKHAFTCGPHRVVQRTVTPWLPVPEDQNGAADLEGNE